MGQNEAMLLFYHVTTYEVRNEAFADCLLYDTCSHIASTARPSSAMIADGLRYMRTRLYKPNTKPLSYRTNDENSRSDSLLTFKCEVLFQMNEQSYSSLFTLTNSFIPMSIKRLLCDFEYKPMSSEKLAQVISSVQGLFLKLFKTTRWNNSFFCKLHY